MVLGGQNSGVCSVLRGSERLGLAGLLVPGSSAAGWEQVMLWRCCGCSHPPLTWLALREGENRQRPLLRVGTTAVRMVSSKNHDSFLGDLVVQIGPNFNSLTEGFCGSGDNAVKRPWGKRNPSRQTSLWFLSPRHTSDVPCREPGPRCPSPAARGMPRVLVPTAKEPKTWLPPRSPPLGQASTADSAVLKVT